MELRSGSVKMSRTKSINEIPNEILEMILQMLPTQDLIRSRSVSKLWKSFTSALCRHRHVTAMVPFIFTNPTEIEEFYDTFQNSNDLPWSACDLELIKNQSQFGTHFFDDYVIKRKPLKRFVDTFGPQIRKLNLSGDNIDMAKIALMEMPNLEVLISVCKPKVKDMRRICAGNRLELNKLKRLEVVVRDVTEVKLLEFLVESSPKLEEILVDFDGLGALSNKRADLSRMMTLISSIPSIGFHLWNMDVVYLFRALKFPELKIKQLTLESYSADPRIDDEYILSLEQILAENSKNLENLSLMGDCFDGSRLAKRLELPIFSKLKDLSVSWHYISSTNPTFIKPFTSKQFPVLNEVRINIYVNESNHQLETIFGLEPFEAVQKLTLYSDNLNPMVSYWGQIFPNLVTLNFYGVTLESHFHIYQTMTKLEHLSLTIFENWNGITCGYPKDPKMENPDATTQTLSLSSLKNLKTLCLNFGYKNGGNFPDSKEHLALLHIHQLNDLTFQNIEISEEVKRKLGAYHAIVEVHS